MIGKAVIDVVVGAENGIAVLAFNQPFLFQLIQILAGCHLGHMQKLRQLCYFNPIVLCYNF